MSRVKVNRMTAADPTDTTRKANDTGTIYSSACNQPRRTATPFALAESMIVKMPSEKKKERSM
jgi:peptide methionine sulfoxide reductase MsrA